MNRPTLAMLATILILAVSQPALADRSHHHGHHARHHQAHGYDHRYHDRRAHGGWRHHRHHHGPRHRVVEHHYYEPPRGHYRRRHASDSPLVSVGGYPLVRIRVNH